MKSRGLEVSFAWIFAIVVGALILFLALYATFNFISQGQQQTDTEVAAQLVALLSPVETGIESGKYSQIQFNGETRVINRCSNVGVFGEQSIATQVRSFGNEWGEEGVAIRIRNKYVFSASSEEGTVLHLFVKPLSMPYKVGDVIVATMDNYCFIAAPNDVFDELKALGMPHVSFVERRSQCAAGAISVCFSGTGCGVQVDLARRAVTRDSKTVYYPDAVGQPLLYAAIFSDPDVYECHVKRLMKRAAELAEVYADKADLLQGSACSSDLSTELRSYAQFTRTITSSGSLGSVAREAEQLEDANNVLACRLF